jgi:hypothetical protein
MAACHFQNKILLYAPRTFTVASKQLNISLKQLSIAYGWWPAFLTALFFWSSLAT